MQKIHIQRILTIGIITSCLYLIYASTVALRPPPQENIPANKNILQINNISSSTYYDDVLLHRVSAHQIIIKTKRIGLFRIRNVNEIIIDNLAIEQVLHPEKDKDKNNAGIMAAVEQCLPRGGSSTFGRIVGGTINKFRFKSLTADKRLLLDCKADSGRIDTKKKHLEFENITLYNPEYDRTITARKGTWNSTKKRFEIAGKYKASSPKGKATGKGIAIDLYYHLEKI